MSAPFYRVPLLSVGEVAFLLYKQTCMKNVPRMCCAPVYVISSSEILGGKILRVTSGRDLAHKNFLNLTFVKIYGWQKSWNHRIIEWPGLKRTIMIIEFQPPCYVQGRQPPDQAAQSHIQPGLECLQGWGIHSLLGQPVPVRHHPLREKLPPNIHPTPPLSQFKTCLSLKK